MGEKMKDFIGACLLGALLGCMFGYGSAKAQTYQVQNAQGTGYIQQNGNTVNVLNTNGNPVSPPLTVYPTQITSPTMTIGTPSYTVPMTPPSPPSPRVMQ